MDMLSIIVPVYNGQNSLKELCNKIYISLCEQKLDFEVIMVDDNSNDDSYTIMTELKNKFDWIKIIKLDKNYGQQNALLCGLRHAKGNYCVTIDDDLQYDPNDIIPLYNKIKEGYDVVYGIPHHKKHPKYRNIGTKLTDILFNIIIRKPSKIKISSFRIMNRNTVNVINNYKYSFIYLSAVIFTYTKNVANITIKHDYRKYGQSNYNFKKLISLYIKIVIYHSSLSKIRLLIRNNEQYTIQEKML